MSRKTSPARRAAFLKALRETGNQTIAAERAKVSRSWVQLHRSTDPQFKAEVAAAVAEAKASFDTLRMNGKGGTKPPSHWAHLAGEELVVRGSRGRRVQIARARLHQWTPRVEARFLALLERSNNLRLSLKAVGLSAASLHEHRKRWPAFDERCEAALLAGSAHIQGELVAGAIRLLDPEVAAMPAPEPPVLGPMNVDQAIALVRLHERRAWERRKGVGPGGRVWGKRA